MILSYLKYCMKRKGKYSLHSPFIYDFYVNVLDDFPRKALREELYNRLKKFLLSKTSVFNDGDYVIIMDNIHSSKDKEFLWKELKNNENITLIIDCYYFGLLFVMRRMVKQEFILTY